MIFERLKYLIKWIEAWIFLQRYGFWDIHVHARDMNQKKKFTIAKWMRLARLFGVRFGAFMPNTDPTITDEETLCRYINIARKSSRIGVKYQIWLGLQTILSKSKRLSDYIINIKIM